MRRFTADFETNVNEKDCRVWAWAVCEIGNVDTFTYGNDIETFINWCMNKKYNSMCVMRAAHKKPHKGTTKIANTQVFARFFCI